MTGAAAPVVPARSDTASAVIIVIMCLDVGLLCPSTTGRSLEDVNEAAVAA